MYKDLIRKFKDLYEHPTGCEPLVQVYFPVKQPYPLREALFDPAKMFENQMTVLRAVQQVGDDTLPMLRADFGTAQIAAMYGCPLHFMENSEPCAGKAILHDITQVRDLQSPAMTAGWTPKVDEFQRYFLAHKPADVAVQHPDVQGPFNTAHLLRGNDILYDFYDNPEDLHLLLTKIATFMADWIQYVKREISTDDTWFYDAGGLWKGGARMCNCSLQFVSPALYREHILPADAQFLKAVGGGRIHYCGSYTEILDDLFQIKDLTCLEVDAQYHDITKTCERAPQNLTLRFCDWSIDPGNRAWYDRILQGDIAQKRNVVYQAKAENIEDGKRIYDILKNKLCR